MEKELLQQSSPQNHSPLQEVGKPQYEEIELTQAEKDEALRLARAHKSAMIERIEYGKKVFSEPAKIIYDFEQLKQIATERGLELTSNFQVDEANREIFDALCKYFSGEKCNLNPEKGILLYGNVGTGKTTLMRIFQDNHVQCYSTVSCRYITDRFNEEGDEGIQNYTRPKKVASNDNIHRHQYRGHCFDDLGTETIPCKYYGREKNVMADVLLNRYDGNVPFNMTHITTNLSVDELVTTYGSRVVDRMKQMFNLVSFSTDAKSRRK